MLRISAPRCGGATRRVVRTGLAFIAMSVPAWAQAQTPPVPNPRKAQAERPTVATHAYAVATGYVELEAGFQRQQGGAQANRIAIPLLLKVGLGERVQLDLAPGLLRDAEGGRAQSGITDLLAGVKWRLTDDAPLVGALAMQVTVSLPTGSSEAGRGSGKAGVNLLAISSRQLGPISLDINAGYTRLGGNSEYAPRDSTVWTISAGFPVAGRIGWVAELFGYPGTTGPSGALPVVAFLTGPTIALRPSLVLDAGATFDVVRFGGTAVYGGLTWNIGRAWGRAGSPPPAPSSQGPGFGGVLRRIE
jgi:hypothetical protein